MYISAAGCFIVGLVAGIIIGVVLTIVVAAGLTNAKNKNGGHSRER